jgi:hypothetical protein
MKEGRNHKTESLARSRAGWPQPRARRLAQLGVDGSLFLHRSGLAPTPPCRSPEFFQLRQNPSIGHQRLTAKGPTMSARHRWQIEAWGESLERLRTA